MIKIGNHEVLPGSHAVINMPVGKIPSGNMISIKAHVYNAPLPGPTILITAGIHGDEINGIEIVRESISCGLLSTLTKGAVIAIPVVNVYGFINFSRDVPDGKDVNRSFPGSSTGSLASRVARTISKRLLPIVDLGVDFHTGGASRYNYPQVRISRGSKLAMQVAQAFGATLILEKGQISKSLRKVAQQDYQVPIVVFEGGESTRFDPVTIRTGKAGIKRVLQHFDMIPGKATYIESKFYKRTAWIRARDSGIFIWEVPSGCFVEKDQLLGFIHDPNNQSSKAVKANRAGFIVGHNNAPVVNVGDALFHIAYD